MGGGKNADFLTNKNNNFAAPELLFQRLPASHLSIPLPHAPFSPFYFHRRFSVVPSSTPYRQIHPAVVWRESRRLDDVSTIFPNAASGRVCLCAFFHKISKSARPDRAPRCSVAQLARPTANYTLGYVEARTRRRSFAAYPAPTKRNDRVALLRALIHRAAHAALV